MKISDLIRGALDLIDRNSEPVHIQATVAVPVDELDQMKQLAGVAEPAEFANAPGEHVSDIEAVLAGGTDVNQPKHPADIRTNAPSMYPGHQSRP
jgi:hypothetical protein